MRFDRPTLITITAPTCSGKTYLLEGLSKLGFNRVVGFTTRGPRPGEREGVDYNFITVEEAKRLEEAGLLAESAEFRGNYYGVTHAEMNKQMNSGKFAPIVILEPKGLVKYEKYCAENDYDIFKVFVSVPEALRIKRLNDRTSADIKHLVERDYVAFQRSLDKIINTHSDRLMSITGDERLWITVNHWDAVVPGNDYDKAVSFIEQGIKWRNSQKTPVNM